MQPPRINNTLDVRREAKQCPTCGMRFSRDACFCPFDGTALEQTSFDPAGDRFLGVVVDGRYEVLELLGEGGTGRVYRVRHAALGRLFAMKVLRRDLAQDAELAGRFIQEAKATGSIRHPNIVEITDFGRLSDDTPYLVMELLVGRTLAEVIKADGPLLPFAAVPILRQIAGALAAAHAAGVVHRDLKPDNVFLVGGSSTVVRIVDFGAAKVIGASRVTRAGIVFGTPHYMSPEQASGQPVDHRADIYSLGVIMYEMFTGRVPFQADTYMGVLTQHMFVQPVPPSQVLPAGPSLGALEEITLVCLSKKPEERYASMDRLAVEIAAAASRSSPPEMGERPESERPLAGLPRRGVRPWMVFGGLTLLSFVVALAVLVHPRASPAGAASAAPAAAAPSFTSPPAPLAAPAAVATAIPVESLPVAASEPPADAGAQAPAAAGRKPAEGADRPARPPRARPRPKVTAIDDVGDPFATTR